jgi:acyl carrier protein
MAGSPIKRPSMTDDNNQEKIQRVVKLVAGTLDIPEDELGPDSSMDNTPAWDSFEHMNICLSFERLFGIKLDMDAIISATSIRALAMHVP